MVIVNLDSPRIFSALRDALADGRPLRCFGQVHQAAHELAVLPARPPGAVHRVRRRLLLLLLLPRLGADGGGRGGRGARHKASGGPLGLGGAPGGQHPLRGSRALRRGALPHQVGVAAAGVGLTGGGVALALIGGGCAPLHAGALRVVDGATVAVLLLDELQQNQAERNAYCFGG